MTSETELAKEAKILDLFDSWPNATPSAENVRAYLSAVDGLSLEALSRSVAQFSSGKVERNNAFPPSSAELAENARAWQSALGRVADAQAVVDAQALVSYPIGEAPPEGMVALGPLTVDFGSGPIDMRDKTAAEKDEILQNKGLPSGAKPGLLPKVRSM